MPNPFTIVKAAEKLRRLNKIEEVVRVAHPLNPKEVYTFPAGTDPKRAREMVRDILLMKARGQMEKIDLPSELPPDREKILKQKEEELERAKRTISDLEARKDLRNMGPGIYQDDNTGRYYRVTDKGYIEELVIDNPPTE